MKNTTAAAAFRFLLAALIADRDDRKYRIYSCRDKARLPHLEPVYPIETGKISALTCGGTPSAQPRHYRCYSSAIADGIFCYLTSEPWERQLESLHC